MVNTGYGWQMVREILSQRAHHLLKLKRTSMKASEEMLTDWILVRLASMYCESVVARGELRVLRMSRF